MEKKFIIGIILFTVLLLAGGTIFLSSSGTSKAEIAVSQNAKADVALKTFDWGIIKMNGGNATKDFIIKNTGTDTLKLSNIRTSCHCTKAQVTINGQASPSFGMNSISSWIGEVPPNGQAVLLVVFDPLYHGTAGLGQINRLVDIETNDPNNKTIEFSLTGTVVNQ